MGTILFFSNLIIGIVSGITYANRENKSTERLNKKFKFEWPTYKSERTEYLVNFIKDLIVTIIFLCPILNIGALSCSLFSKDETFDKFYKEIMGIYCTVKENPEYVKEIEPKKSKSKKKFNIKDLLKKKEIKKEETPKEEVETKEDKPELTKETEPSKSKELIEKLNEKVNETPKEENKPFIRTALQPEGQLPFEVIWENDHVYSGTIRSLKR